MMTAWGVLGALVVLCACTAYAEEEEFNVFSTLRKSNFSVNLSEYNTQLMGGCF